MSNPTTTGLQEQLAAEQKAAARDVANATQEIIRLSEQLAAAVETLKEIKGHCGVPDERRGKAGYRFVRILNAANAALAKIQAGSSL